MAKQLQIRQGTASEIANFTGAVGELTYDETNKTVVVHDGVTKGGIPLAKQQALDTSLTNYLPLAYPTTIVPQGYLVMMGQAINPIAYPILYGLYGAYLPDMRAYTIRGLDNGRGIDIGRSVLSTQQDAIRNITGKFCADVNTSTPPSHYYTGAFFDGGANGSGDDGYVGSENRNIYFDASRVVPTADENRIKNIAFLYIVKAG